MKKIFGLLSLLGLIWLYPKNGNAELWPAATGDSLTLEVNCLDSAGRRIACDSIFVIAWRQTTGAAPAFVDSGRATAFPATVGTFRIYQIAGSDQTYYIRLVGNATVGLYRISAVAYGGTDDGVRLNVPYHRYYLVGSATTTNFYANADVDRWNSTVVTGGNIVDTLTQLHRVELDNTSGTLDAAEIGTDAIGSAEIAAGAADEIADSTWGAVRAAPTVSATTFGAALDSLQDIGVLLTPAEEQVVFDTVALLANQDPNNLIHDPGFEGFAMEKVWFDAGAGTPAIVTNGTIKSGRKVLRFGAAGTDQVVSDSFRLVQGQRVFFGADIFASNAATAVEFGLAHNVGVTSVVTASASISDKWNKIVGYYKVTATDDDYVMYFKDALGGTDTFRIDNAFVILASDSLTPLLASDNIGINWGDITNPTTTQGLSGTQVHVYDTDTIGVVDSVLKAPRTHTLVDSVIGIARIGAAERSRIADTVDNHPMTLTPTERLAVSDTIWDERQDGHTVTNSFGLFVDTTISSRSSSAGSTDTLAIRTMMLGQRFARHRSAPGSNLDTVNALVSGTVGAGAWLCSLLVVDSATSLPVQGVTVWVTTSGALTTDDLPTNSAGNVVFNLDNGTHAAHIFKSLTRLAANADTVINISGANFKDTISIVSPSIPASPIAGQVTIAGNLYDISADEAEGAVVTFYLNEMSFYSIDDTTNMVAVAGEKTVTVDSTGYWQVNIYPTTKLVSSDRRNPPKYAITIQWPNGTTRCTEYEWTFDTTCCQALQWQLHRWKVNCSR